MIPNLVFRKKARVVAFVDLILTSASLVLVFFLFAGALVVTVENEDLKNEIAKDHPEISSEGADFMRVIWLSFIVISIVVFIQLVAAIKLLNATQIGKGLLAASKLARFWIIVTSLFTVFAFIVVLKDIKQLATNNTDELGFLGYEFAFDLFNFIIRVIAISIVHQFIIELEQTAATSTLPVYEGQVPMSDAMAYSYARSPQDSAQTNI